MHIYLATIIIDLEQVIELTLKMTYCARHEMQQKEQHCSMEERSERNKNHSLQKSSQTVMNKTPWSGSYLFSWNTHWSAYHISSNLVVFKKCLRRRQLVFSWFFLDDFIVLCTSLSHCHTRSFTLFGFTLLAHFYAEFCVFLICDLCRKSICL